MNEETVRELGILNSCGLGCWGGAMRFRGFRGRGQASRVPWLYDAVLYGWAEHTNSVAL